MSGWHSLAHRNFLSARVRHRGQRAVRMGPTSMDTRRHGKLGYALAQETK